MLTSGSIRRFMKTLEKEVNSNVTKRIKEAEWKKIFAEETAVAEYVESYYREVGGAARLVEEGEAIPSQDIKDGWKKRVGVSMYGVQGQYTERAFKLGDKKLIAQITEDLSAAPAFLLNTIATLYWEYADKGLSAVPQIKGRPVIDTICADGKTIAATDHGYKSDINITYSNKSASYLSLTADTMFDVINTIELWRLNNTDLADAEAKQLIIGAYNQKKAYELLHSETDSETANRSDNALRSKFGPMDYTVLKRMVDPTEWGIITNWDNDYKFNFAWKPQTDRDFDKERRIHKIIMNFVFGHGVGDPRRIFFVKQS